MPLLFCVIVVCRVVYILVLLQLFYPNLVGHRAEPRNEHSKARTPGPTEAYIRWYVAGSAVGASNAARRS